MLAFRYPVAPTPPSRPDRWPSWKIHTIAPKVAESESTFSTRALTGMSTLRVNENNTTRVDRAISPRASGSTPPEGVQRVEVPGGQPGNQGLARRRHRPDRLHQVLASARVRVDVVLNGEVSAASRRLASTMGLDSFAGNKSTFGRHHRRGALFDRQLSGIGRTVAPATWRPASGSTTVNALALFWSKSARSTLPTWWPRPKQAGRGRPATRNAPTGRARPAARGRPPRPGRKPTAGA